MAIIALSTLLTIPTLVTASDLTVEATNSQTAFAKVHLYGRKTRRKPGQIPQDLNSYDIDRCYRILYNTKKIQIDVPATCANGTRAIFTTFPSTFCTVLVPASIEITDGVVDQCLHVAKGWSTFALVCDGNAIVGRESRSLGDILRSLTPWKVFALITRYFFFGRRFMLSGGF
jgi:hypothetical protein